MDGMLGSPPRAPAGLVRWSLCVALAAGCGRSHGADSTDASTPRDMPPDAFDLTLALGCSWETEEVSPSVSLRGVSGAELGPVWLVGGEGRAFAWLDGAPLESVQTERAAFLSSAWHDGVDSLWATELPGTMWRLRDDAWERFDSGADQALLAVEGVRPASAWAVGIDGTMAHWNGERWDAWTPMVPHHLTGLSALADDDVWAVGSSGESGVVLHFDGTEWSVQELEARLHDVTARAADDVWAVGDGVFHWDGRTWSEVEVGASGEWIGVAMRGERVWLAGAANRVMMRDDEGRWLTALEDAGFLWDLWVHPFTGDVWVTGEGLAHRCVPFFL